jgi:hypothetical protein
VVTVLRWRTERPALSVKIRTSALPDGEFHIDAVGNRLTFVGYRAASMSTARQITMVGCDGLELIRAIELCACYRTWKQEPFTTGSVRGNTAKDFTRTRRFPISSPMLILAKLVPCSNSGAGQADPLTRVSRCDGAL